MRDIVLVRSLLGLALAGVAFFSVFAVDRPNTPGWWVAGLSLFVAISGAPLAVLGLRERALLVLRLVAAADAIVLLVLVHLSGGPASAAAIFLIWPVAEATFLLGERWGLTLATATALAFGGLYLLELRVWAAHDFLAGLGLSLTQGWPQVVTVALALILGSTLFVLMSGSVSGARAEQAAAIASLEESLRQAETVNRRLSALEDMGQVIQRIQDLDVLLPRALARMASLLQAEAGFVALGSTEPGGRAKGDTISARLNLEESSCRSLLEEALSSHADIRDRATLGGLPEETAPRNPFAKAGFADYASAPLRLGELTLGMVLICSTRRLGPFDLATLSGMSGQLAIAIKNVQFTEELHEANEELLHLDQMKSDFLATMSHELRTPLTSVVGYSDMLLSEFAGPTTEKQKGILRRILTSSEALLNLINDILDLTKIEAGKLELSLEPLDLRPTLFHVFSLVESRAEDKQIKLSSLVPGDLPPLLADPSKFEQILLNLLTNAIKFTGNLGRVTVEARVTAGLVEIRVTDTGIGVSPEDSERIFERFTQVDNTSTRSLGGTGLGLAITKDLIELHGGGIRIQSQVGKGSTFIFTIPQALEPRTQPNRTEQTRRTSWHA